MDLRNTPGYLAGFDDAMNVRELGGLPAADGRHVRHGVLFRGGPLAGLTHEQREAVDGFGLRLIFDLRAEGEATLADDYVPSGCEYVRMGGMVDEGGNEVDFSPAGIEEVLARMGELEDPDAFMRELYLSLALGGAAARELLGRLVGGQLPAFIHCTAGKDRTGVCVALVLMALGVPDEAIMQDFLLTNEYRRSIIECLPDAATLAETGLDQESWAKANGVEEATLEAVFAGIDDRHATREAFLSDVYGLTAGDLAALRARCLE